MLPAVLPTVSVVIPVKDRADELRRCLDPISRIEYPQELLQVIVVDDGSSDRSAAVARESGADAPNGATEQLWELRLYTAGQTPKSVLAFNNLKRICEEYMPGRYQIEVIDLLRNPRLAKEDQIVAINGVATAGCPRSNPRALASRSPLEG